MRIPIGGHQEMKPGGYFYNNKEGTFSPSLRKQTFVLMIQLLYSLLVAVYSALYIYKCKPEVLTQSQY